MTGIKPTHPRTSGRGIGLSGGSEHYRAYIGPPHYYDLMAAMAFNLLTTCGLREDHKLLDIGCGSLRMGRLLIPYLLAGGYTGIEPNRWLVEDGLLNELGTDILTSKKPHFIFDDKIPPEEQGSLPAMDMALAQSIFTHCARDQIRQWLQQIKGQLKPDGVLFATYFFGEEDYQGSGWIYPDCAFYRPETMAALAREVGFSWHFLDWRHPRNQCWVALANPEFDRARLAEPLTWNAYIERLPPA